MEAKRFPKDQKLHVGDQVSLGSGRVSIPSPLQMAYATAILANRGVAFKPHLVKRVQDARTGESRLTQPAPSTAFHSGGPCRRRSARPRGAW